MFWTIHSPGKGDITLCEKCALPASNAAFIIVGMKLVDSMEEASVVFDVYATLNGSPNRLSSSEFGKCDSAVLGCPTPARFPNEVA